MTPPTPTPKQRKQDALNRLELDALRADGYPVTDEAATHLTPAQHDYINFYSTYSFDIDAELRREGRRPLRVPA